MTLNRLMLAAAVGAGLMLPAVAGAAGPDLASLSDPVAKGEAVAEEWDARDRGFGDSRAAIKMILENRHGQTSVRQMRMRTLEVPDPEVGDKSLVIFDHPADVDGTAFLSHAKILDPDDQWLYLPALRRVKRISSNNKSGPFVGSEFAYEDFSAQELGKYAYRFLREEACGALTCAVLEQTPLYEDSGYTKMVAWYDLEAYRQQRIDYYDRKGDLLKTLTFSDYRQHLDRYWRAHELHMVNHQTGKKTTLVYDSFEFRTGLDDRAMSKNSLKRVR